MSFFLVILSSFFFVGLWVIFVINWGPSTPDYCLALFLNFLPTPLALLTEADGSQNVRIAPEAFTVASAEFPDQIDVWQNALPGALKGKLSTVSWLFPHDPLSWVDSWFVLYHQLSGAKVLQINGQDPFVAVNANALITGSFQALGTRQNS